VHSSSFSIPYPPANLVSFLLISLLLAIVKQNVLAYAHIFHELTQRTVIWFDVGKKRFLYGFKISGMVNGLR